MFLDVKKIVLEAIKMYISIALRVHTSGLAIIDTMEQISAKVETIAIGCACFTVALFYWVGIREVPIKNARIMPRASLVVVHMKDRNGNSC